MTARLYAAPSRPNRKVDRSLLLADGPDQLSDHVGNGSRRVPEGFLSRPRATFTAREREVGADLAFHLHFSVRGVADQLDRYCAIVQHSPVVVDDTVRVDTRWKGKLRLAEPQPPKVDKAMFVLVPEVVDGPDVSAVEPVESVVVV
jgi:hypothetical protein